VSWKTYVIVSAVPTLVATYLVANPPATTPSRSPAATRPAGAPAAAPSTDIAEEAARLQARVRDEIAYQEPSRNPFRYVARRPEPRASAPPPEAVVDEPAVTIPPPQPPQIAVAGITTKTTGGVSTRTAVLMTPAGPVEVSQGDPVGAEYRVVRIEADAVELEAADGTRRRLNLRP
jgi:hypothetical protein